MNKLISNSDEKELIEFDCNFQGSEAGGQTMRTALAVSTLLQKPIRIFNIRKGRSKPGLRQQHLVSVKVLAELTQAELKGAKLNSTEFFFKPKKFVEQDMSINLGGVGSITLFLQTILPSCLFAKKSFSLNIIGGTDVEFAPSINYFKEVFLPTLNKMGTKISIKIKKRAYFPKGIGKVFVEIKPSKLPLKPIKLQGKPQLEFIKFFLHSSGFPSEVCRYLFLGAKKELERKIEFGFDKKEDISEANDTQGYGLDLIACFSNKHTIGVNSLGKKGIDPLNIGQIAARKLLRELNTEKQVDVHLADQLIPFMALAKGKSIIEISSLSSHTLTNIKVCEQLLGVKFYIIFSEKVNKNNEQAHIGKPATIFCHGLSFSD